MKKIAYARENDKTMTKFCLYMLQLLSTPRFSLLGVLGWTFAIFALTLWVAMKIDSIVPFGILAGIAFLLAIPAVIGAVIRDKRL